MELTGKNTLVTGGAKGIGEAIVRLFLKEGSRVLVADKDVAAGEALIASLDAGDNALFIELDVTDEKQVAQMVTTAVERFGSLDCAVNNAGITGTAAALHTCSSEEWHKVIGVSLTAVWLCMKYELQTMLTQTDGGAIVNISSGSGVLPTPGLAAYCAAKHGVLGLTKTAAKEYHEQGIRCNAVLPGSTWTPMMQENLAGGGAELEKVIRSSLPGGEFAEPRDIAEGVLWLCSARARFVNGHSLYVDGGAVSR